MTTAGDTTIDAAWARRIVVALGVVLAAHAGVLLWVSMTRDTTVERTVEAPPIVAMLLRDEPPDIAPVIAPTIAPVLAPVVPHAPAPAAVATPQAATARSKPPPAPHLKPPRSSAAPAPSVPATASLTPDTARPATPAAPPVAATPPLAPATNAPAATAERAAPSSATPKSVSRVDCDIPKPDYPDISKRRSESGTAVVRFVVGLNGHIETSQLQKSSGYARLDDAALAAVHAGVCQPYRENGEAVRAAYSESFVFGLTE